MADSFGVLHIPDSFATFRHFWHFCVFNRGFFWHFSTLFGVLWLDLMTKPCFAPSQNSRLNDKTAVLDTFRHPLHHSAEPRCNPRFKHPKHTELTPNYTELHRINTVNSVNNAKRISHVPAMTTKTPVIDTVLPHFDTFDTSPLLRGAISFTFCHKCHEKCRNVTKSAEMTTIRQHRKHRNGIIVQKRQKHRTVRPERVTLCGFSCFVNNALSVTFRVFSDKFCHNGVSTEVLTWCQTPKWPRKHRNVTW